MNARELVEQAVAVLGAYGVRALRRDPRVLVLVSDRTPAMKRAYRPEVRARLTAPLASVIETSAERPAIVITPFVAEPAAEVLRARDVDYVDLAGNVLLRWDSLVIDVRGRKLGKGTVAPAPRPLRRPFTRSGAQVTFSLLAWPELVSRPLREVSRVSGVSLGSVQAVLRDLGDSGYLLAGSRGRSLARAGELLDHWVEAYALSLSPSLHLGYYQAPDPFWWKGAGRELRAAGVALGGEAAASMLDDRLRPAGAVLYAAEVPAQVFARYRCRRAADDSDANVTVRRRFWTIPDLKTTEVDEELTPAVLIYADLLASGDPRQREHAHRLRTLNDRLAHLDRS